MMRKMPQLTPFTSSQFEVCRAQPDSRPRSRPPSLLREVYAAGPGPTRQTSRQSKRRRPPTASIRISRSARLMGPSCATCLADRLQVQSPDSYLHENGSTATSVSGISAKGGQAILHPVQERPGLDLSQKAGRNGVRSGAHDGHHAPQAGAVGDAQGQRESRARAPVLIWD